MNISGILRELIRGSLQAAFPAYTVVLESAGDDDGCLGVAVYGVEKHFLKAVQDEIFCIEERVCGVAGIVLIPLVRDQATTRKFYPQHEQAWSLSGACLIPSDDLRQDVRLADPKFYGSVNSTPWQSELPAADVLPDGVGLAA